MAQPHFTVACGLIEDDGKLLIGQRPLGKRLPGKWELIGGKIEAGETPEEALIREIKEELDCVVEPLRSNPSVTHQYDGFSVTLCPIICKIVHGEPKSNEHADLRWVSCAEIFFMDMADADVPVLKYYCKRRNIS